MAYSRIASLSRATAISVVVAFAASSGAATSAFANDPAGGDPTVEIQSAQSARYGNPNNTPLARATTGLESCARTVATGTQSSAVVASAPSQRQTTRRLRAMALDPLGKRQIAPLKRKFRRGHSPNRPALAMAECRGRLTSA